jgi:hypothetical protein
MGQDILLLQGHVGLLHAIDLFSDELHLADLSGYCSGVVSVIGSRNRARGHTHTLMLKAVALTQLSLKLGTDLVEELVEAARVGGLGHAAHAMRIHGHGDGASRS